MRGISFPLVIVALAACGGETTNRSATTPAPTSSGSVSLLASPPPPFVVPAPPAARDDGRLPATATPLRYVLALQIDPSKPRFSGETTILVDVPQPTWHIVLHGRDLHVSSAEAIPVGAVPVAARATARLANGGVVPEELVLTFEKQLPAGSAALRIRYDASFADDLAGLYRVAENGESYGFSQFEATDARRAFPCFDEPAFKTAYDVTIVSPKGMVALSNTPEDSHVDRPDGTVVHHFETSPPLPSYLVAFAVGDFDILSGQTSPFPIRVVTTHGRAKLASLALEAATVLVSKLGDYFNVRYPYAKLDLVAVPDFAAGAMENPGLVTFRDLLILVDPIQATTNLRRRQALVIAHELAHQWFGDLVTMQWWNDIWLNEGFATWAAAKVVDEWKPAFGAVADEIAGVQAVMDTDSLRSARAVRQPVRSSSDAEESFDELTYEKGAAVLRMIESWLGPDTFRRGIQRYVIDNAWKSARAEDLFKALEFVSAQKVGELASGFLDQPGVPDVTVAWRCGGKAGGQLELQQSQWWPLGARPGAEPSRKWIVPLCIASDIERGKSCFTLGEQPISRNFGPRCPGWLYPNADQGGYYRYDLDRAQLLGLADAGASRQLDGLDRMGLVAGTWAEVRQGREDAPLILDVLPRFDADMDRHVVEQVITVLEGLSNSLVEEGARDDFRRYAGDRLRRRAGALGWQPAKATATPESEDRVLQRRTVLTAMGELVEDQPTLAQAETYAANWLKDPASVPAETAAIALPLASKHAGATRLQELRTAAKTARTPEERMNMIRAMGSFDDAAVLRQALDLMLTDELRLSDLNYLFGAVTRNRVARPVLFAWEQENWGKLLRRVPGPFGRARLVAVAGTMCTKAERAQAEAFFVPATQGLEGVKRPLDEDLERAGVCVALRDRAATDLSNRLKRGQ